LTCRLQLPACLLGMNCWECCCCCCCCCLTTCYESSNIVWY